MLVTHLPAQLRRPLDRIDDLEMPSPRVWIVPFVAIDEFLRDHQGTWSRSGVGIKGKMIVGLLRARGE